MGTSDKPLDEIAAALGITTGEHKVAALPGDLYAAAWADRARRSRGRQAAITRNLYTWSNYKNWADKVRGNWELPKPEKDKDRK